jgi:hypothetical protein
VSQEDKKVGAVRASVRLRSKEGVEEQVMINI